MQPPGLDSRSEGIALPAPIPSVTAAPVRAGAQDHEKGVAHVRAAPVRGRWPGRRASQRWGSGPAGLPQGSRLHRRAHDAGRSRRTASRAPGSRGSRCAAGVRGAATTGGPATADRAPSPATPQHGDVTGAGTAVLRNIGKVAAGAAPAVALDRLGLPALAALVFLAVLTAGVTCWLLGSDARAARASQVLRAWKGHPESPAVDSPAAPALPTPHPRHWPWPRRP